MKITSLFSQSLRSIWNNKIRSGLTILGIVIGIAAVISLVGLGKGLQASVVNRIGGLGTTQITIRSQNPERQTADRENRPFGGRGGFNFGNTATESLTDSDYEIIRKNQSINLSSPEMTSQVDITLKADADEAVAYQLYGIDFEYFNLRENELAVGDFLTRDQIKDKQKLVIIGQQAVDELFPDNVNPLYKKIFVSGEEFTVIGVLQEP